MLTWNAERVENFKEKNEAHPGTLDCFIWAALAIGMNEIKESNVKEWAYRINRMKFEGSPLFIVYGEDENGKGTRTERDISEDDVRMWIGLKTNVSQISNSAFDKLMREKSGR